LKIHHVLLMIWIVVVVLWLFEQLRQNNERLRKKKYAGSRKPSA